jgi:VWFA-related protein
MHMRCTASLFFALALAALPLAAQQPSDPAQAPPNSNQSVTTIHTTARLVVLDVVVNDGHGHPVKGLKESDFDLTEDGVPQTLRSFTEHDATLPPAPPNISATEPALPPNTFAVQPPVTGNGAMTVIVLGNVHFLNINHLRDQLRDYLNSSPITTPIAIFRVDDRGLQLVQGFTADRKILLETVASKRILPPPSFVPDDHTFVRGSLQLTRYLAGIRGRINLIWFASGVQSLVSGAHNRFPDITTFLNDMNGRSSVLQLSRVAVYAVDTNGLTAPAEYSGAVSGIGGVMSGGGGLSSTGGDGVLATRLASTGGKLFYNTNGFKEAIAEAVDIGSHYYTISYSPANPNWDGAYRSIHVQVAGYSIPTGWSWGKFFDVLDTHKVAYRDGYFARDAPPQRVPPPQSVPRPMFHSASVADRTDTQPNPQRHLISVSPKGMPRARSAKTPMQSAMTFATPTPTQIHFNVTVTPSSEDEKNKSGTALPADNFLTPPFQGASYRKYTVRYRIDPKELQFSLTTSGIYRDDIEFIAIFFRDDGLEANSIAFTAHIALDAASYRHLMGGPIVYDQTIAMPDNGFFFLRAGVHELPSGHIGVLEIPAEWVKSPAAETLTSNTSH